MSKLLPTFERAFNSAGKAKAALAREMGISTQTLQEWLQGVRLVPVHKREKMEAAFGRAIDWPQACADYRAKVDQERPPAPPPAPPKPPISRLPPQKPPEAPKRPASAPRPPAAPKTPEKAPEKPQRRLFGLIPIIDDTED